MDRLSQNADSIQAALQNHAGVILQRLQSRAAKTHATSMQAVLEATPQDVQIRALSVQGLSKKTYEIRIGDYTAILSVFTVHSRALERTPYQERLAFRRFLRAGGVATPGKIGSPFDMPGVQGKCELTEMQPGYQKARGSEHTETELASLGDTMGRMHTMGRFAAPFSLRGVMREFKLRKKGLPYGYVHNDFIPGNIFFDPETHKVCGVIDFEWAQKRPFAAEIVNCLRSQAIDVTDHGDGIHVCYNPRKAQIILDAYEKHRTLTEREMQEIERLLPKWLREEQQYFNEHTTAARKNLEAAPLGTPAQEMPTARHVAYVLHRNSTQQSDASQGILR